LLKPLSSFVDEHPIPREAGAADTDCMPDDLVREMGLFGRSIPEEFGGIGLTMEEKVLVMREISRTSPAFHFCFTASVGIGSKGIHCLEEPPLHRNTAIPDTSSNRHVETTERGGLRRATQNHVCHMNQQRGP
jgi:alkylation response protein AidB-like acyl-CoA dehydrogenase